MVSNIFLNKFITHLEYFKGTFSCDNIPNFNDNTFSVIVNLSPSTEIGTHFVAITISKKHSSCEVCYFDSFGVKCHNQNILSYMKKYNKEYFFSKKKIQHMTSEHCGLFAMGFVMNFSLKKKPQNYLDLFSNHKLKHNDNIITKYILHNTK